MTTALEIKPGKYRTRDGRVAEVTGGSVVMGDGQTYDVSGVIGPFFAPTAWMANGATWHPSHSIEEHGNDLIERIEDEKAECTVKFRRYEYFPSFDRTITKPEGTFGVVPVAGKVLWESGPLRLVSQPRKHVSDAAWEAIQKSDVDTGTFSVTREYVEELTRKRGCMYRTVEEMDELERRANACGMDRDTSELLAFAERRIARLEAENESLSRQLRSRERNKESAGTGKKWRWGPMV